MTQSELREFWQQAVVEWQTSGLSGAAYCKQQSLAYHQFTYWRQKFVQPAEDEEGDGVQAGFTRVTAIAEPTPAQGLVVSLPNGISITGIHPGNIGLVGDLLRQL